MVSVLTQNLEPLMPCSEKRARKLMETSRAKPYWFMGVFCIILQKDSKTYMQEVCIGIDPGSQMSAFTIKSESHTFINAQYSAPNHIKSKVKNRKIERRARRQRNTPYRKSRFNRAVYKRIPPSTKSRWIQHLNHIIKFSKIYPITIVSFEDVKAKSIEGLKKWNKNFSPLEVGKNWFYSEVEKLYKLHLFQGFDTYTERQNLGLTKGKDKLKVSFESHCVDSWVLANLVVGGHVKVDWLGLKYYKPLNFYRRKLHTTCPTKGGKRRVYGGTISLGINKGVLVKHKKYGNCLVGGSINNRISLHCIKTNKRLCQNAKKEDLTILTNLKCTQDTIYHNFKY